MTAGIAPLITAPPPSRPRVAAVAAEPGEFRWPAGIRRAATVLVGLTVAVLAFWIRYRLLANAGGLGGVGGYDDGVYYAAADALVHGRLPYRDFLFLQPPGIALVLAPFAWLGALTSDPHGVVLGRTAFLALGAANAVLVTAICRRFGAAAAVVGGIGYAVFFPAAYAERSMLLEPVGTFGVLVALLLTQRRAARSRLALAVAGAALALAVTTKIWYAVPAVLIALLLWNRRVLMVAAGFAVTVAAIVLPFLVAAPAAFVQQVLLDQLHRDRSQEWSAVRRLAGMLALRTSDALPPHQAQLVLLKLAGLLVAGILLSVLALTVRGARRYVVLSAAAVVVLLAAPSYFPHYGALLAPTLAIAVGVGVGRLAELLRRIPLQVAVVTLALLGFALVNRHVDTVRTSEPFPAAALRPATARVTGCVTADDPLVLAELNVLSRDLGRGCTVWIDVTGATYGPDRMNLPDGHEVLRESNPRWQRDLTAYLLSGDAVIVHRAGTGMSTATHRAVTRGPALARSGRWVLHAVPSPAG